MIWEMVSKGILEHTLPGSGFLKHLEAQILKNLLFDVNHGGVVMGSMYVPLYLYINIIFKYVYKVSSEMLSICKQNTEAFYFGG